MWGHVTPSRKGVPRLRTLLLDNTFFPVKVITWQRAMVLLLTGRAEVVLEYRDKTIRSVNAQYSLPMILRLFSKHQTQRHVKFTRLNVYLRDRFTCQYCAKKFQINELTFDHVLPASRGGKTNWDNIVTSCAKCNTKKGNLTPQEAGMKLLKPVKPPQWSPMLCLRLRKDDPKEWFDWFPQNRPFEIAESA